MVYKRDITVLNFRLNLSLFFARIKIENELNTKTLECGIVENPKDLKAGDIVSYKNRLYFFRPNGSISLLYSTLRDYKRKKNKKCVDRSKLEGQKKYALASESQTEDLFKSLSDTESEETKTLNDIQKSRPTVINLSTEEWQKTLEHIKLEQDLSCSEDK